MKVFVTNLTGIHSYTENGKEVNIQGTDGVVGILKRFPDGNYTLTLDYTTSYGTGQIKVASTKGYVFIGKFKDGSHATGEVSFKHGISPDGIFHLFLGDYIEKNTAGRGFWWFELSVVGTEHEEEI
jgi:hypothetical protein